MIAQCSKDFFQSVNVAIMRKGLLSYAFCGQVIWMGDLAWAATELVIALIKSQNAFCFLGSVVETEEDVAIFRSEFLNFSQKHDTMKPRYDLDTHIEPSIPQYICNSPGVSSPPLP